jgi:hypothetical protein
VITRWSRPPTGKPPPPAPTSEFTFKCDSAAASFSLAASRDYFSPQLLTTVEPQACLGGDAVKQRCGLAHRQLTSAPNREEQTIVVDSIFYDDKASIVMPRWSSMAGEP